MAKKEQLSRLRRLLDNYFGVSCYICSSPKYCYHEIHGKPHPLGDTLSKLKFILRFREDFKPLCFDCHRLVHSLAVPKDINEERLLELLKEMRGYPTN